MPRDTFYGFVHLIGFFIYFEVRRYFNLINLTLVFNVNNISMVLIPLISALTML